MKSDKNMETCTKALQKLSDKKLKYERLINDGTEKFFFTRMESNCLFKVGFSSFLKSIS